MKPIYTKKDLPKFATEGEELPGKFPFTRGPYPTMYSEKVGFFLLKSGCIETLLISRGQFVNMLVFQLQKKVTNFIETI